MARRLNKADTCRLPPIGHFNSLGGLQFPAFTFVQIITLAVLTVVGRAVSLTDFGKVIWTIGLIGTTAYLFTGDIQLPHPGHMRKLMKFFILSGAVTVAMLMGLKWAGDGMERFIPRQLAGVFAAAVLPVVISSGWKSSRTGWRLTMHILRMALWGAGVIYYALNFPPDATATVMLWVMAGGAIGLLEFVLYWLDKNYLNMKNPNPYIFGFGNWLNGFLRHCDNVLWLRWDLLLAGLVLKPGELGFYAAAAIIGDLMGQFSLRYISWRIRPFDVNQSYRDNFTLSAGVAMIAISILTVGSWFYLKFGLGEAFTKAYPVTLIILISTTATVIYPEIQTDFHRRGIAAASSLFSLLLLALLTGGIFLTADRWGMFGVAAITAGFRWLILSLSLMVRGKFRLNPGSVQNG